MRRAGLHGLHLLVVLCIVVDVTGYLLFSRPHARPSPLGADAVVVLGGQHDGREQFGIDLAIEHSTRFVVLSNPYPPDDEVMRGYCEASFSGVRVLCVRPDPMTTRGEALMVRRLADTHGWADVTVVSWRYHLPRAKFIFDQCFSRDAGRTTMRETPLPYSSIPAVSWHQIYLWQYAGLLRAVLQGPC